MDRKIVGMSDYPSIYLSTHPSIHPSIDDFAFLSSESTDLSVCQPIHLSVFPSICLALDLSMQPSIHHPISVNVFICPSFFLLLSFAICSFPCLSVCLPSCSLSIYLAIYSICSSSYPFYQFKDRSISPIQLYRVLHLSTSTVPQQAGNIRTDKTQSEQILGFSCGVTYKT